MWPMLFRPQCAEYEKIACMYPKGMERWRTPGVNVSETKVEGAVLLMLFLVRVLYGSPAAPRRFAKARDAWVLDHFNSNGQHQLQWPRHGSAVQSLDIDTGTIGEHG